MLCVLLLFAAAVRAAAYSGFFGSDEVTYTGSAFRLLQGDWSVSNYVGANRYGVNLPVAGFALVFGMNEFAAAIYSLLSSLGEVALVAWFGTRMLGLRAGVLAGLILATLPIHVHFAGRLMADAPLCLAVTASFLFFWDGEARQRRLSYVIAGLAAGWAFWIKPATIFYLAVFLTYPFVFRRVELRWGWMVLGFAVAMLANGIFFQVLTGNFMYVLQNMAERRSSGYLEAELAVGSKQNSPHFYFTYLFGKLHHTWLLGYLALIGLVRWRRRPGAAGGIDRPHAMPFVVWWALGMIIILSLLVVSFSPPTLIPKQTNYMLMFVAPLALMAGWAIAGIRGWWLAGLATLIAVPSVMLALLLQASVSVFTANSKAAVRFAAERPGAIVYGNTGAYRAAEFERLVNPNGPPSVIRFIGDWPGVQTASSIGDRPVTGYAIVDTETLTWAGREPFRRLEDRPSCWVSDGVLQPVVEGNGILLMLALARTAGRLPLLDRFGVAARLDRLSKPAPAYVFRIPEVGC